MNKRRNVFFIVGSILFAFGMIWGGLTKIQNNQVAAGVVFIVLSVAIIALCSLPVIHGNRNKKN
ncbi:MAG: hypothetical protein K6T65_07965 [Peptococcaceae bacterium]|nr:hypothetical protein [Peptococcaceae bacterium]